MKTFIALSFFVAFASAGILPNEEQLYPVAPLGKLKGRITNGAIATPGQFPYQVGLYIYFGNDSLWCGGTIISNRLILTAAHCTFGADGVAIYFGAVDITGATEKWERIYTSKSNIVIHDNYKPSKTDNDISLLKLPVLIEFNEFIQPVALPKKNGKYSTYEGKIVVASGWGLESDSAKSISQFLRYVEVPVMKQSECNKYYVGTISKGMLCIQTNEKKSTCSGDSGGPLVYVDNGVKTVIGIASFGASAGCEKGWPRIFTRVTSYLDWIEDVSGVVNN